MKRFAALVLLLIFASGCIHGLADTGGTSFDATLANALDMKASEWFSSTYNRAALTAILVFSVYGERNNDPNIAEVLTHSTYVYKSGMDLGIVGRYGNNLVLIGYSPMTKRAEYYITDAGSSMSDVALELAVSQLDTEGYYKNDVEDVVGVLKDLSEALGG